MSEKELSWFMIMLCFGFMVLVTTVLMPPEPWVVLFTLIPITGMIISFLMVVKETMK